MHLPLIVNLQYIFFPDYFVIQDLHTKRTIGKGEKHGDLYILSQHEFQSHNYLDFQLLDSQHVSTVSSKVWHDRLAHLSFRRLEFLQSHLHSNAQQDRHIPCYVCPLAKQHRLPFPSFNHMSKHSFDLVHCDIWGPFNTTDIHGFKYFLTLVDDSTRFTWVHMLRAKSDAAVVIPKFFRLVETQFNTKI